MDPISSLIVVIASLFIPPLGVFFISGCSVDFIINIGLTMLGYLPGLLHALYLEYIYYSRREDVANGVTNYDRAPGVYSDIIQRGGFSVRRIRTRESGRVASPSAAQYRDNVAESTPSQPQKHSPSTTYEGIKTDVRQEHTDAA
ncbi:hypothetical protein V1517DRAFT_313160 [Lipomyces orientalis]|uniref:Uncharacterized protein n=1 Tax=Lipomyces orientalis TaxID=1233043 RepID=A0ACC3TYX9_9ASCO